MDELISKQVVIEAVQNRHMMLNKEKVLLINDIEKLPSAEPKRIIGKWIGSETQCGIACSKCGVAVDDFCHSADYMDLDYKPNYCPNCGAKMEVTE